MKVLIVDDVASNRVLPAAILRRAGFDVDDTDQGSQALSMLAAGGYDIVLLDVSMPGMSGLDVCAAIRSDPALHRLRVIAYTAHAYDSERATIMAAGFDDLLVKPINKANLLQAIQTSSHTE